jgi:hypothetical protein
MKIRAAVSEEFGAPLEVQELDLTASASTRSTAASS